LTHSKQAASGSIHGKARGFFAPRHIPVRVDAEVLRIHGGQRVFVFNAHEQHDFAIRNRKFRPSYKRIAPATWPLSASIAVASSLRPLKVKTRFEAGS
jgi:hypothetical protein